MTSTISLQISDLAAERIKNVVQKKGDPNLAMRISIIGGGCAGFSYEFSIELPRDADIIFTKNDAKVIVDPIFSSMIDGAELHYIGTLANAAFEVRNPNATSKCGCGASFSI